MSEETPKKVSTREKILGAAKTLFLEQGFNGTSMSDIARLAGVNQSLIHHHFDTKEKLWGTIRDKLFDTYLSSLEAQVKNKSSDPQQFMLNMMQLRFDFLKEHPEISRMMEWQSLAANSQAEQNTAYAGIRSNERIKALLKNILNDFEANGDDMQNDKKDRALFLTVLLILTSGWFQGNNQWLLKQMLGADFDEEELSKKYIEMVKGLITKGAG